MKKSLEFNNYKGAYEFEVKVGETIIFKDEFDEQEDADEIISLNDEELTELILDSFLTGRSGWNVDVDIEYSDTSRYELKGDVSFALETLTLPNGESQWLELTTRLDVRNSLKFWLNQEKVELYSED